MKRDKSCLTFLIPAGAALLISGIFLLMYSRLDIHLFINSNHTPIADSFFRYITHFGDGWIFALALPFAFIKDLRSFFVLGFTGLFVLLFTAILKKWIFLGLPRPSKLYEGLDLYYVPGVELHSVNSFPSGHSMAAFGFYFAMCYVLRKKTWALLLITLALLVGYSRMYLSQHFLVDVFVGGLLGITCGLLAINLVKQWSWEKLNKNILELIRE